MIVLEVMKNLTRILVHPDANGLWLFVHRLMLHAGRVVAVVDDAGARDIVLSTKDAYQLVIEPNGMARQVRAVARDSIA
jgi:hypothetical protein